MNYRRNGAPQSVRILIDKHFPAIDVSPQIQINSIKGEWMAQRGYYVKFKLLVTTDLGQLNLTSCMLEATAGGVLRWRTPLVTSVRSAEVTPDLYKAVLGAFEAQPWITLIGSSRLQSTRLELPPEDPLAKALKAAQDAL